MKAWRALLSLAVVPLASGEDFDKRLTVHTIIREDIFAGFMVNDLERLAAGEKKLEQLLVERPASRASLLAWKGGIALFRSARANEAGNAAEAERLWKTANQLFDEALQANAGDFGRVAVTGAAALLFADRLPQQYRDAANQRAYGEYRWMWERQNAMLDKLPLHIKGELLAGLAQSAHRTGRADEAATYLEKMSTALAGTPYESRARKWKEDPSLAGRTSLVCQTCHDGGRLAAAQARLAATPAP